MSKKRQKPPVYDSDGIRTLEDRFSFFGLDEEANKIENFGDLVFKISPPVYRFFVNIPNFFKKIKWSLQRIFRKGHYSDLDLWGLDWRLNEIILPKLIAFRNQNLHGYPATFSEWDPEDDSGYGYMGMTKEEYDKAKAEGHYVGGGFDAWLATLDEMIYAFEHQAYSDDMDRKGNPSKKRIAFFKKYGYLDPHRETEDNKSWSYLYKTPDGGRMSCGQHDYERIIGKDKEKYKNHTLIGKFPSYYDKDADLEQQERAAKGFELFGRYFRNLWD